jgi:uncharacterized protein (DUF433 family)
MIATEYAHVVTDESGIPMLAGTHVKVVEIAEDYRAHRSSPEVMQRELPHFSLGQILSALAYYFDHQQAMDEEIERRRRMAEDYRLKFEQVQGPSALRAKLKAKGLLP